MTMPSMQQLPAFIRREASTVGKSEEFGLSSSSHSLLGFCNFNSEAEEQRFQINCLHESTKNN